MKKSIPQKYFSLKNKIFLTNIAVTVIALISFWFISSEIFYNTMIQRVKNDTYHMMNTMADNIDTIATTVEDYTRVIAQSKPLQNEIMEYLRVDDEKSQFYKARLWSGLAEAGSDIINPSTIACGMAVFIEDEVVYSGYDIPKELVYSVISPEDLETARQKQKPVWNRLTLLETGNPYDTKEYVFPISKLIRNKNTGESLGVVTLFVSESYFSNTYDSQNSGGNHSDYYIVDENGYIISSCEKESLLKKITQVTGLTPHQYKSCTDREDLLIETSDIPILYSSTDIRSGWKLFCVTSLEDVAYEQTRMKQMILCILAAVCCLLLVVSWLVARTVTKPVYQLLDTMNQIKKHQTNSRVSANISGEMGLLAQEFNSLMDSLEASQKAFYNEQKMKRRNEYKLLQAQVNPHFLYNTMETIASFIKLNRGEEALIALRSLVDFYRLSLSSGREIITVEEEIRLTESYIKLQSLRYREYVECEINFSHSTHQYKIPKLTIQPLVENAIYHGIKESHSKGKIMVTGLEQEDYLMISVFDTGRGIEPDKLTEIQKRLDSQMTTSKDSFGLGNISQRLGLLYGDNYKMTIESVYHEFTKVTIRIPLESEERSDVC